MDEGLSDDDGIGDGAITNAFCCPICEEMHIYTRRQWYLLAGRHVQRCMCKRQLSSADLTRIQRQKFAKQGMHECTKCKKWMHNVGRHAKHCKSSAGPYLGPDLPTDPEGRSLFDPELLLDRKSVV